MLVILGVVFATIFMIFAALGVILGHPHAGQRVIGTAAGLMLLLMGYSIYKIVMINAFRFSSSTTTNSTLAPAQPQQDLDPADTPTTPADPIDRPARSNMPVYPFANAENP
jgi:hypothetical protein